MKIEFNRSPVPPPVDSVTLEMTPEEYDHVKRIIFLAAAGLSQGTLTTAQKLRPNFVEIPR